MKEKYTQSQYSVEQLFSFVKAGMIAIPEIQRPFLWKPKQVRDLIDTLYNGYPAGYLIISQSPNLRLKDGTLSEGKKIMIDGQQRVTAMMTSLLGIEVLNADFEKKIIKIAFNPLATDDESNFEVQDSAILKDKKWIPDISEIFKNDFNSFDFVQSYHEKNPNISTREINEKITQLQGIKNRQIGVITLDRELGIDIVTEIFIRINNQGTKLNQADFVMSKIAANVEYDGNMLRKAIDYFSHLSVQPNWYSDMEKDSEFMKTNYAQKLKWLKDDKDSIYTPNYSDMLRVAFMYQFSRGKLKDLVALLSGRDFEERDYKAEISKDSFSKLSKGVIDFMNEYHFKKFTLTIKNAGFIHSKLTNSDMTMDFAYTLYLLLLNDKNIVKTQIEKHVQKWYVMTTLTSRYISSPETVMDMDLRRISEKGFLKYFSELEQAELSDSFWDVALVQRLETTATNSPFISVFWAAQIYNADDSLFSKGSKISNLISTMGDVHHIFPKAYLIANGIRDKLKYNQVANYTYFDSTINKIVGDKSPDVYFSEIFQQIENHEIIVGNLKTKQEYDENLLQNCIPKEVRNMTFENYDDFLAKRRILMARKIKNYYKSL